MQGASTQCFLQRTWCSCVKSGTSAQEEVARRSGLATVTISKLEEGRSNDPKVSTVCKLSKALGCPIEALLHQEPSTIRD